MMALLVERVDSHNWTGCVRFGRFAVDWAQAFQTVQPDYPGEAAKAMISRE
jgi:hypothetical protein